jgi:hypothetical protein
MRHMLELGLDTFGDVTDGDNGSQILLSDGLLRVKRR